MGNRFTLARHLRPCYSPRRVFLRLNERDFEPHRMRAYGDVKQRFAYRQMFEWSLSGQTVAARRSVKKAARFAVRKQLIREQGGE